MRKIQDFETFKNFYLKTFSYINNYEEERKEKLLNQEFKENIMLITDDEFILLLDKKPKIDNDLWYDDETPRPEVTLDYFKNYNEMNFKYDYKEYLENNKRRIEQGICSGQYSNKLLMIGQRGSLCGISYFNRERDYSYFIRELTDEEESYYLQVCDELKQLYDERLERYFKRYRKNIFARGYWVNR